MSDAIEAAQGGFSTGRLCLTVIYPLIHDVPDFDALSDVFGIWLAVETVGGLLAISFGFAAGAMLTIVAIEMAPRALSGRPGLALLGAVVGGVSLGALSLARGSSRGRPFEVRPGRLGHGPGWLWSCPRRPGREGSVKNHKGT